MEDLEVFEEEDYLEMINLELGIRGAGRRFESLEQVKTALDDESRDSRETSMKYGLASPLGVPAGVVSHKYLPEVMKPVAGYSPDEIGLIAATASLTGALGLASLSHLYSKRMNSVDDIISEIEDENYDRELAQETAEKLK
ncbi:MAG: hypothetical protein ACI8Z7_000225 [Candidatus Nanohaloarchaea archaeon]|jgi:hypothetical protein